MTDVWFYHLEHTRPETALPGLLEKCVEKGWRVYVQTGADEIAALDRHLWVYRPDSFLAHGRSDQPQAEHQPILIGAGAERANKAQAHVTVGVVDVSGIDDCERVMVVFDGHDPEQLQWARGQWKTLKSQGHTLSYWQQGEAGRWEKKS